ncbi:MAG: type VI secretion system ATPase TssH, partial [Saprospiraceae bacterium]|nr:type VI secretion system ATPase TssH [Saprospiraceae bacterium]
MNLNNLTIKAQEVVQKAQQLAMELGSQAIEPGHFLEGMFAIEDSPVNHLLKKLGLNPDVIRKTNESIAKSYVKGQNGGQSISRQASEIVQKANISLKTFGDEFVAVEHLFLGLLQTKDQVSQMLKDYGIKENDLIAAIKDMRKGSKVHSQSAEN